MFLSRNRLFTGLRAGGMALSFFLCATVVRAAWDISRPEGNSPYGHWVSLALDAAQNPRFVYRDGDSGGNLRYVRWTGTAWTGQTVEAGFDANGGHASLALTASGDPRVSYYKTGVGLRYASWNGSAWAIATVDPAGGQYTSLALDGAGNAHISYSAGGSLKHAKWDGISWTTRTVDGGGSWTSLALDGDGKPAIAYHALGVQDLKFAQWTGASWSTQTVDSAGLVGAYASLAIGPEGFPRVSYQGGSSLKYAAWNGSSWSVENLILGGIYTSLKLDASGNPRIAYGNGGSLRFAKWTGSAWAHEIVDPAYGSYASLVLDGAGRPSAAYGSNFIQFAKPGPPAAPTMPIGTAVNAQSLAWTWVDVSSDEDGFRVLRAADGANLSGDLPTGATYWMQTGLIPNTSAQVYVQVFNSAGHRNSPNSLSIYTPANPPVDTTIVAVFSSSATLSWGANGNPAGTVYLVERSTDNATFIRFFGQPALSATATDLLAETPYFFRVRAHNNGTLQPTAYDAVVSTITPAGPPLAPQPPSLLRRTVDSLTWAWTDVSNNEDGFRVKDFFDDFNLSGDLPAGTTFWTQGGLTPNARGIVYVEAFNGLGAARSVAFAGAHTLAAPPSETAISAVFITSAAFSWNPNGNPDGTAYLLERSTDGISFVPHASFTSFVSNGVASSLSAQTFYHFRLRATSHSSIDSDPDVVVSTRTRKPPPAVPSAPTVIAYSSTGLTWRWLDNAPDETGYRVLNAADGANLSGDLPAGTTVWAQTGLTPNTSAQVQVEVFNEFGASRSPAQRASTLANRPAGTAFSDVFLSSAVLSWSANGNPPDTLYRAERSTDNMVFSQFYAGSDTLRVSTGLLAGVPFFFRVRAENREGSTTSYDATASTATPPAAPLAPGGPSAFARTSTSLTWTWTDRSHNEDGFRVRRASDVAVLAELPANQTSWTQTGLDVNARQQVQVEAYNALGSSSTSRVYQSNLEYTLADPPVDIVVTDVSPTKISLSWSAPRNPSYTEYEIYSSTNQVNWRFGAFVNQGRVGRVEGLTPGSTHYFRIRSINESSITSEFTMGPSVFLNPGPPPAPSFFSYEAAKTTSTIDWRWRDTPNEEGFRVIRSTDGQNLSGDLAANTVHWLMAGLAPAESRRLRVESFNAFGSSRSLEVAVAALPVPPARTEVLALSPTSARLSWSANGNASEASYDVSKSTDNVSFFHTTTAVSTGATIGSLVPGAIYYFKVRASNVNSDGSAYDRTVDVTMPPGLLAPVASTKTASSITWSWLDAFPDETLFRVRRSTDRADLSGDLPPGTTFWTQGGLAPNSFHAVVLEAEGPFGSTTSAPSFTTYTPPNPPVNPVVATLGSDWADIAWEANGNPSGTPYDLYVSSNGVNFYWVFPNASSLRARATGMLSGATYYFQVRAKASNHVDLSAPTPAISALIPFGPPRMPKDFYWAPESSSSVRWNWEKVPSADGYRLLAADQSVLFTLPRDAASALVEGLTPGAAMRAQLEIFNAHGSSRTALAIGHSALNPPKNLTVTSAGVSDVSLAWDGDGNPSDTIYLIQSVRSPGDFRDWDTFNGTSVIGLSSGTSRGLLPGTTHYLRVRARFVDNFISLFSPVSVIVSTATRPGVPAPTGRAFTVSSIEWSWPDAFGDETAYRLRAHPSGALLTELSPNETRFIQWDLGPNAPSQIFLEAVRPGGVVASGPSAVAYSSPFPPTAFSAVPQGGGLVSFQWSSNGNPAGTEYRVMADLDDGDFSQEILRTTSLGGVAISLLPGRLYTAKVVAVGSSGEFSGASRSTTFTTLALPAFSFASGAPWIAEVVDAVGDDHPHLSIAADPAGRPMIAYNNTANGHMRFAEKTAGLWSVESLDQARDKAQNMSIAVDRDGRPHVSYELESAGRAKRAYRNEDAWSLETLPMDSFNYSGPFGAGTISFNGQGFQGTSMAVGPSGSRVIGYTTHFVPAGPGPTDPAARRYFFFVTGGGNADQVASLIPPRDADGSYSSGVGGIDVAMGADGTVHAAYWHDSNGTLRYGRRTVSGWSHAAVASGVMDETSDASIALAPDGNPRIVFFNAAAGVLECAFRDGSSWSRETILSAGDVVLSQDSLAMAPDGTAWVAFARQESGDILVARRTGAGWEIQMVDNVSGGNVRRVALAVDPTGRPHVAYHDGAHGVLKYAAPASSWAQAMVSVEGGDASLTLGGVTFTFSVPPGAFSSSVLLTARAPSSVPEAVSSVSISGTGAAVEVVVAPVAQPAKPVTITAAYAGSALAGMDGSRLALFRHDPERNRWVPLPMERDPAGGRLTARTDHFSLFQIMALVPGLSVGEAKAYPNPLLPGRAGHDVMTFSGMPADAGLKIYTLQGELARELRADAGGDASWDGRNDSGAAVASGVYLVRINGAGGDKILKVAVQR